MTTWLIALPTDSLHEIENDLIAYLASDKLELLSFYSDFSDIYQDPARVYKLYDWLLSFKRECWYYGNFPQAIYLEEFIGSLVESLANSYFKLLDSYGLQATKFSIVEYALDRRRLVIEIGV